MSSPDTQHHLEVSDNNDKGSSTSNSSRKVKKDFIWSYFKEGYGEKLEKAKCVICETLISRGGTGKTATNASMKNHLQRKHTKDYDAYISKKKEADTLLKLKHQTSESTQMSIASSFAGEFHWTINDLRSKKFHTAIAHMMAVDNEPYNMVEREGFKRFMSVVQPRYTTPGRTFFASNLIPDIYIKCKDKIVAALSQAKHVSFTTDIWTAKHCNESFISLTAHFVSESFDFHHYVLNSSHFPGSHTGELITSKLTSLFQEWKVEEKIHLILRDNASSMIKAMEDYPDASCFIHTLQLVILDAINSQRAVIDTIAVSKNIVTHFNHSPAACERLKNIQTRLNMTQHKLIQDVSTRWNSTYYMLQRNLEQKDSITFYASEGQITNLTENQWKLVASLLALLQPFEEITKLISESECIISEVIPTVATLKRFLQKDSDLHFGVGTMKETLKKSLLSRFGTINAISYYSNATFLDPRFKNKFFNPSEGLHVKQLISKEILEDLKLNINLRTVNSEAARQINTSVTSAAQKLREDIHSSFWNCYSEIAKENEPSI